MASVPLVDRQVFAPTFMGIYDREYYRDETAPGIRAGGPKSMVTTLLLINIGVAVVNLFTDDMLVRFMEVSYGLDDPRFGDQMHPNTLDWRAPWRAIQLLTYGFAHDPQGINHILFNMFALWMFGRDVEGVYGPKEFLRIYLTSIVLGGLFFATRLALTDSPGAVIGASGAVTTVVILFCMHFPKRTILLMFVFPVPAWVLGILIVVFNLFGDSGRGVAYDVHLVGAAFGFCYGHFRWNLSRFAPQMPKQLFKPRPRLKIHDPADADRCYEELDSKADELLEKVNRDGIESLSSKERRLLEDYSRRMRQKHR